MTQTACILHNPEALLPTTSSIFFSQLGGGELLGGLWNCQSAIQKAHFILTLSSLHFFTCGTDTRTIPMNSVTLTTLLSAYTFFHTPWVTDMDCFCIRNGTSHLLHHLVYNHHSIISSSLSSSILTAQSQLPFSLPLESTTSPFLYSLSSTAHLCPEKTSRRKTSWPAPWELLIENREIHNLILIFCHMSLSDLSYECFPDILL